MNLQTLLQFPAHRIKEHPILSGIAGLVVLVIVVGFFSISRKPVQAYSSYEVRRGDFLISVVEGGTLEAVNEVVIRSEVEGTARIIYIVPEGSYVRRGDLLVELDSSSVQDAVNQQQINVERAQFSVVQAQQQLDIQKSQVDSEIAAATLRVEFAELDLDKFLKGEARQLRRNAEIEITNVLENLQIAIERLQWSEQLYTNGFETKGNLDRDRLTVSQSRLRLEQTTNSLWMVQSFDIPKRLRTLESAVQEAREHLERVKLQGERRLAQFTADLASQRKTLDLSTAKLERDTAQLEAAKIYAPQDGLVVYGSGGGRFSNESMIEEGAIIRNRQEIIKLPDVSVMKVIVKIHESHINQVRRGQPSFVVLDSMPDRRFSAVVSKVAPLPDSQSRWANPDLKVYATEVLITEALPNLKPGASARAEVIITNLPGVLTVPIQSVTTRNGQQVVFRADTPDHPIPVSVGMYNTKFIEIVSGVNEGDSILLAPPFDLQQKDLGGSIIADGEAVPPMPTNALPELSIGPNGNGVRGDRPALENGQEPRGPVIAAVDAPLSGEAVTQTDGVSADRRPRGQEGDSGGRTNRPERMRQFDTNGDGELDDAERSAVREQSPRERRRGGSSGRSPTN